MLGFVFRRKRSSGENGDSRERRSAGEGGNGGSVAFSSWGGKRSVAGGDPLNRVVRQADINNLRRLARSTSFSAWGGKKWNMTRSQFYNNYYTNWKSQAWLSLILLSALNIPAWYSISTRHCWQERQSPSCLFCPHTEKRRIMRGLLMTSPSQKLNIGYQWQPARQYISRKTWPIFAWQLKDLHFESHSNIITF